MKLNSKIFLGGILAASVIGTASANPVIDVYAGASLGAGGSSIYYSNQHKNYSSQSFGGVFGIDIPLLRVEAEYNHLTNDDFSTNDAMLNAYFKMFSTMIHPYAGVGVGSIFGGTYEKTGTKVDIKTSVAYQGMLGLTFDILAVPLKFDVEGRVLYAPNFIEAANSKPDFMQYDARLKLRYIF